MKNRKQIFLIILISAAIVIIAGVSFSTQQRSGGEFICPDLSSPAYDADENVYWINCIPPIASGRNECTDFKDYTQWVKQNCSFDGDIQVAE